MGFKRKGSRIEVSRGGRLQRGALSAPCKVLDVSETGVRIESRLFVKIGDTLQLVIELEQGSDRPISSTSTCRPVFPAGSRSAQAER